MSDEPFVTVAQAARLFGVTERRVRHAIERSGKHGANVPQTRQQTVRTKTGERSATAYPTDWIREVIEAAEPSAEPTEPSAETRRESSGNGSVEPSVAEPAERSTWRERALVAEVRAELLERERNDWQAQARAAQENISRLTARIEEADSRLASVLAATGRLNLTTADSGEAPQPEKPTPEAAETEGGGFVAIDLHTEAADATDDPETQDRQTAQPEAEGGPAGRVEGGGRSDPSTDPRARRPSWWARLWGSKG